MSHGGTRETRNGNPPTHTREYLFAAVKMVTGDSTMCPESCTELSWDHPSCLGVENISKHLPLCLSKQDWNCPHGYGSTGVDGVDCRLRGGKGTPC